MKKWIESDLITKTINDYNDNVEEIEQGFYNRYTKQEVDDELNTKADKATTYTKQEVDDELNTKADKLDTYTKQEVDDKFTEPLILENLIENGDFSDGTNGWASLYSTNAIVGGKLRNTGDGTDLFPVLRIGTSTRIIGDIYYIIYLAIPRTSKVTSLGFSRPFARSTIIANPLIDVQYIVSVVGVATSTEDLRITHSYDSLADANGSSVDFDDVITINLTETFGAGNEPTKEEMDEIINITGWFDNEYALSNKEMFIALLNMIRKNTMAITALGGTQ